MSARSWRELLRDKQVLSWCLYDWANSAFATTVMAGFFPVFFKQYWSAAGTVSESTAKLGLANTVASFCLGISAPFLGAIADRARGRKKLLFAFTFLGALSTAALFLVAQGNWLMAALLYVLGSMGFSGAQSFYDALLVAVAKPREMDLVSGLGYGLGYLGGGVLFAINVFMTLRPEIFGLASPAEAVQISFLSVGVWWLIFTVPLLTFVNEPELTHPKESLTEIIRGAWSQLIGTFHHLRSIRPAYLFLIANFFYIDGVNTMIKMAVDYGMSLGFPSDSLIVALLLVQFIGFPAAIGFSAIASRISTKRALYLAIGIYALVTAFAATISEVWHFYALAGSIGLVQGGIQALSRSAFGQMIPADKSGEFFGFFNMLGRFSSILGPTLIAITSLISTSPRLSLVSLLLLFATGGYLLSRVPFPEEHK